MEEKDLKTKIQEKLDLTIENILKKDEISLEEFKILQNYLSEVRMLEGMKSLSVMGGFGMCN